MENTIKISCEAALYIPFENLIPMQGNLKDLSKENYEKLKNRILKRGITSPIHVWVEQIGDDKKIFHILDGHQRQRVLSKLREEGYTIPNIPIVPVHAANLAEAKEELLAQASQYGNFNSEGLYEYIQDLNLDPVDMPEYLLENYNFGGLSLLKFNDDFLVNKEPVNINEPGAPVHAATPSPDAGNEVSANAPQVNTIQESHIRQVSLYMDKETHDRFTAKIQVVMQHLNLENVTDAVVKVMDEYTLG